VAEAGYGAQADGEEGSVTDRERLTAAVRRALRRIEAQTSLGSMIKIERDLRMAARLLGISVKRYTQGSTRPGTGSSWVALATDGL
jgi:hypothetical protein